MAKKKNLEIEREQRRTIVEIERAQKRAKLSGLVSKENLAKISEAEIGADYKDRNRKLK